MVQNPHISASAGIIVVGTGALGSEFCSQLGQSGIARVLLVDPDRLQPRNLACSEFLTEAARHHAANDTSPHKAPLLAEEAARAWSLPWLSETAEIADIGLQQLTDYDLLCCCTDSALSRAETAYTARLLHLPMLDCAVLGSGIHAGRVTWFSSEAAAACYLCGIAEDRRAHMLAYAASGSMGCAPLPTDLPMTGTPEAVRQTIRAAMDRLHLWLNGDEPPSASTAWRIHPNETSGTWPRERIALPQSQTCPWHETAPRRLVSLPWEQPLQQSLQTFVPEMEQPVLQLQWPLCTRAVCGYCSSTAEPMHRVAWVRRHGRCTQCGNVGVLQPTASVSSIAANGRLAHLTPRQLNLPGRHLYHVRSAFTSHLV